MECNDPADEDDDSNDKSGGGGDDDDEGDDIRILVESAVGVEVVLGVPKKSSVNDLPPLLLLTLKGIGEGTGNFGNGLLSTPSSPIPNPKVKPTPLGPSVNPSPPELVPPLAFALAPAAEPNVGLVGLDIISLLVLGVRLGEMFI